MEGKNKIFLSGNEAAVLGAIDAGAKIMYGYPITPATEILQGWINAALKNKALQYLQTEDEIAAGFCVAGSVIAGTKAFTASAGPGHILLQDAISMSENMRIPFVGIMMQRGGPSTGTVIYSQQEVNLAAFGGNGDGLRVVYSASSVLEMYELTIKAFETAWKYHFPTFLLGDGYLGKMKQSVALKRQESKVNSIPLLSESKDSPAYLRNCYSLEEEFGEKLAKNVSDWKKAAKNIALSENVNSGSKILIIAHGLVAAAAKEAIKQLKKERVNVGLFRPITLNPVDSENLIKAAKKAKKIYIIESSLNQLSRIIKYELSGLKVDIIEVAKPAEGFTPDEIINVVRAKK